MLGFGLTIIMLVVMTGAAMSGLYGWSLLLFTADVLDMIVRTCRFNLGII